MTAANRTDRCPRPRCLGPIHWTDYADRTTGAACEGQTVHWYEIDELRAIAAGTYVLWQPPVSPSTNGHAAATFPDSRRNGHQQGAGGVAELPKDDSRPAARFALARLGVLLAEPELETDWLVEGLLIAGGISLLGAKPKVGKSTLARNLAVCVAQGLPFLDRVAAIGPVVNLALEEKRQQVAKHFRLMGATDEPIYIHVGSAPDEALAALTAAIAEHQAVLAIADPLLKLIRSRDANDYAEVSRTLEPLIDVARTSGCHILCVHHLGKGERTGGDAILGSTALFGAVDAALLMKRREHDRTLETVQRYGEDLPETLITLDPATGCTAAAGDVATMELQTAGDAALAALGDEALTESHIKERVGGNQTLTAKAIRVLLADGTLGHSGAGRRGDPYVYRRSPTGEADVSRFTRLPIGENRVNRENPETSRCPACDAELEQGACPRCDLPAAPAIGGG